MSTEHQKYSTQNQGDAIRAYAERHGLQIVRRYEDEGRSGLSLGGRTGLQRLLYDVETGDSPFSTVLVYDVSRWGRFQDADESAYYEYRCRRAGVRIEYCAELFENDGSIGSDVQKVVKRRMAAEYSRELSVKVFAGQSRLVELGFRQGGAPGFGLRRQLVGQDGGWKFPLKRGENKSIQTDRVILVPGPPAEVDAIKRIFWLFVEKRLPLNRIALMLRDEGVPSGAVVQWHPRMVSRILRNEKYVGDHVWNKRSYKLKQRRIRNSPDMWIRSQGAFEPIVARDVFDAAQRRLSERFNVITDQQMLDALRRVLDSRGHLSRKIIDTAENCPSSVRFKSRFGSLHKCYELIGYEPRTDRSFYRLNKIVAQAYSDAKACLLSNIKTDVCEVDVSKQSDLLLVGGELRVALTICRCKHEFDGRIRWLIKPKTFVGSDIVLAACMDSGNTEIGHYSIFPAFTQVTQSSRWAGIDLLSTCNLRAKSLARFVDATSRVPIREVKIK